MCPVMIFNFLNSKELIRWVGWVKNIHGGEESTSGQKNTPGRQNNTQKQETLGKMLKERVLKEDKGIFRGKENTQQG